VTPLEYDFLRKSLKERSGLVLSADKQYLVESRLLPIARKAGLANLGELVAALRRGDSECLMTMVVEAMTTNETFFFRDKIPFENFRTAILPALLAARRASRCIRIWSAAASTGQEPYSLAMTLKELERSPAGASRSSPPIWPAACCKRRRPGSTASSRFSAGCRSSF
jgi:chemotaxis protein methyltransferase CheR